MSDKAPVVLIMGPTASGKTALAKGLYDTLPCEIINVDSTQFYRDMDIGSAKPNADELRAYPHRMLSFLDPAELYSVGRFVDDVCVEIDAIHQAGRVPLLVGGSMMYFKALVNGLNDLPPTDLVIRRRLEAIVARRGIQFVHRGLAKVDEVSAKRLHPNDSQRILRALEVFLMTGSTLSSMHQPVSSPLNDKYEWLPIILCPENRALLHEKIACRVDAMLDGGLVSEVEKLYTRGDLNLEFNSSIRSIGYRQVWMYFDGVMTYESMRSRVIIATRQFAKRQYTWLRSLSSQFKRSLTLDSSSILSADNDADREYRKQELMKKVLHYVQTSIGE
ncbi:MAG: tRNA (adenosine(37)-N6)-dimethylallyltransferase MiaA [Pseudomonadota bacterium]